MFINLTPHAVNIGAIEIAPEPVSARVRTTTKVIDTHEGVEIVETVFGQVEGLPEPREGVFFVVSRLVIQAAPSRKDLLAPGELVRDEQGRIIGCKNLSR